MSVGYDHIDVAECARRGIVVGHTPGVLTSATADLAVLLLLAASRRLIEARRAVLDGTWGAWAPQWMCGPGLAGAVVGIVGLGRIGSAVARRLRAFEVAEILYAGRRERADDARAVGATWATLPDLLRRSDFVLATCALVPEVRRRAVWAGRHPRCRTRRWRSADASGPIACTGARRRAICSTRRPLPR